MSDTRVTQIISFIILGAIIALAAWLRLSGSNWDGGYQLHPDERGILFVAQELHLPQSLSRAFDPRSSPLNPYRHPDGSPRLFAYGPLPLYTNVITHRTISAACGTLLPCHSAEPGTFIGRLVNSSDLPTFDHLTYTGRALSALFDALTVLSVFLLATALFNNRLTGLLSASLLAFSVIHIQNAHFGTVDSMLAFWCTLTLYLVIQSATAGNHKWSPIAGIALGLAVATKITAILLIAPLVAAHIEIATPPGADRRLIQIRSPKTLALTLISALAAFLLANPYALLDAPTFIDSIALQTSMASGTSQPDFILLYSGTLPILYSADQLARWGFGPALALASILGLIWAGVRAWKTRSRGLTIVIVWIVIAGMVLSSGAAKFPRYLLPITPALIICTAAFLTIPRKLTPAWRSALSALTVIITVANALAFHAIYDSPHPWLAASQWIYANIPPGQTLLVEARDDALPLDLNPADGGQVRDTIYTTRQLDPLGAGASCAQIDSIASILTAADIITIASSRNYGVANRLPARFPIARAWYQALFDGSLGFDLTHAWARYPHLASWTIIEDPLGDLHPITPLIDVPASHILNLGPLDESFTVYDHPLVLLFKNRSHLSAHDISATIRQHSTCPN